MWPFDYFEKKRQQREAATEDLRRRVAAVPERVGNRESWAPPQDWHAVGHTSPSDTGD